MHKILIETHKDSNILKLRAKDFYFKKAVLLNNLKNVLVILPTCMLIFSYVCILLSKIFSENWLYSLSEILKTEIYEVIIGCTTIISVFLINFLEKKIDYFKDISNTFREDYDNVIFETKRNLFSYDYSIINEMKENGKYSPADYNNWKYEYWYDETFSNDANRNILCMQMDNVLYSYNVFSLCKKEYIKQLLLMLLVLVVFVIFSGIEFGWSMCFLVFLAMFELLKQKSEDIKTSDEIIELNKRLLEIVQKEENVMLILEDLPYHIQCIESCITENRKKGLFLPAKIRRLYIDYYKDLNVIKSWYMRDEMVTFPSSSEDVEILSLDETSTYTMKQLHERLINIMDDIINVLNQNNIPYSLDRGTLLGAVRKKVSGVVTKEMMQKKEFDSCECVDLEHGGFLFWDDTINIVIQKNDEELVKELISKSYNSKYVIHDSSSNDMLTIKRDSFLIRESNDRSRVDEKATISEYYQEKGIFVVINVLSPTMKNKILDKMIKWLMFDDIIHKMDKYRDLFYKAKLDGNDDKSDHVKNKYNELETKRLKRIHWYLIHANDTATVGYLPGNTQSYQRYPIEEKIRHCLYKWVGINVDQIEKCLTYVTNAIITFIKGKRDKTEIRVTKNKYSICIKKRDSYFRNLNIFEKEETAFFEGKKYRIPADYMSYLESIYGESWVVSPFSKKDDLVRYYEKSWYSYANRFHASSLQHIRHMDIY